MFSRRGAGAIEEFDGIRFGGPTIVRESFVSVTAAGVNIVKANPDRVMLILTNDGPDTVTWSTAGMPVAGAGQLIGVSQTAVFQVQNDGQLCGVRIDGIVPLNATRVNIIEVIRQHRNQ